MQWRSSSKAVETSGFTRHPRQSVTIRIASQIEEIANSIITISLAKAMMGRTQHQDELVHPSVLFCQLTLPYYFMASK